MAVFTYTATDMDASVMTGSVVADTPRQARDQLRERGLSVNTIASNRARPGHGARFSVPHVLKSIGGGSQRSKRFVLDFVRELSTLLAVGAPLLEAIDLLVRQQPTRFKPILLQLRDRVAAGVSLAEAMGEQAPLFDEVTLSMTEVGENSGTLDTVLGELAAFKERSAQLKSRIASEHEGRAADVGQGFIAHSGAGGFDPQAGGGAHRLCHRHLDAQRHRF